MRGAFRRQRLALGLGPATPYFNAGLMVIDRARWTAMDLGARAVDALRRAPDRYPFVEQSALNELIAGGFAPLSPRYNFMGDFFLLDMEAAVEPIVRHFVNAPKPWQLEEWRGEARFAQDYRDWFAASPWPELSGVGPRHAKARSRKPRMTPGRRAFADRLAAYLRRCAIRRRMADARARRSDAFSIRRPARPLNTHRNAKNVD